MHEGLPPGGHSRRLGSRGALGWETRRARRDRGRRLTRCCLRSGARAAPAAPNREATGTISGLFDRGGGWSGRVRAGGGTPRTGRQEQHTATGARAGARDQVPGLLHQVSSTFYSNPHFPISFISSPTQLIFPYSLPWPSNAPPRPLYLFRMRCRRLRPGCARAVPRSTQPPPSRPAPPHIGDARCNLHDCLRDLPSQPRPRNPPPPPPPPPPPLLHPPGLPVSGSRPREAARHARRGSRARCQSGAQCMALCDGAPRRRQAHACRATVAGRTTTRRIMARRLEPRWAAASRGAPAAVAPPTARRQPGPARASR
jgi:hypothetical protein